jgi:hypothetical protein
VQLSSSLMKKCASVCIRARYMRAKAVSLEERASFQASHAMLEGGKVVESERIDF